MSERLLRLRDVMDKTALGKSMIYRMMAQQQNDFPPPVVVAARPIDGPLSGARFPLVCLAQADSCWTFSNIASTICLADLERVPWAYHPHGQKSIVALESIQPGTATEKSKRKGMGIFAPDMPMRVAEAISFWANATLLAALAVGVIATYGIVISANVKERNWEEQRIAATERIAANEAQTARANDSASQADARAAEANARAEQARLEMAKLKAPRRLSEVQTENIAAQIQRFPGKRFDMSAITGDPEAVDIMIQIATSLAKGGWQWIEFSHPGGPFMQIYNIPNSPNVGMIGGEAVIVYYHPDYANEFSDAAIALVTALNDNGIVAEIYTAPLESIPNRDTIHVIVGKKPL